jgi:pyruvate/2-oxoglutarate dehydrogenase complex dihydrolipoamide acyltransferase (E2) component
VKPACSACCVLGARCTFYVNSVHTRAHAGSPALCSCAPQHARIVAGEVQAGPLVLFPLFQTSPRCCAPAHRAAMALPWRIALRTQLQRSGAPSSGCFVHASPPTLAHTRTRPCPAAGSMSAAAIFAPARAPPRATPPHRFTANSGPKPEPLTPLRPCAPKHTHTHARSRASSLEWAPRPRYRVPPPRRRRHTDHGVDLASPVASFLGCFLRALATRGDPVNLAKGHVAQAP